MVQAAGGIVIDDGRTPTTPIVYSANQPIPARMQTSTATTVQNPTGFSCR